VTAIPFVAVTNWSSAPDLDVMFAVEAARKELPAFCAAWGIPAPGVEFCSRDVAIPAREGLIVSAVDDDGQAGTLGYHTKIAGVVTFLWEQRYGAWVFLHELYESLLNPDLTEWIDMPDGRRIWREACDAVQADTYPVDVEVAGNFSSVMAAVWLRPEWFGLPAHDGIDPQLEQYDNRGLCKAPFEIRPGGYSVVEVNGLREQIGGARPDKGISTSRTALVAARPPQSPR
jgi:hypothetical protein